MGKTKSSRISLTRAKNVPLERQIADADVARPSSRHKGRGQSSDRKNDQFLDSSTTKKILQSAKKQQEEMENEFGIREPESSSSRGRLGGNSDDDDDNDFPSLSSAMAGRHDEEDGSQLLSQLNISAEDEAAMQKFMPEPADRKKGPTLGDYISEMIRKKEQLLQGQVTDMESMDGRHVTKLDHRVVKLYRGVGKVMRNYRSGKVPKAFKVIPSLRNWEQVLGITSPDKWTSASVFVAVRVFCNAGDAIAQRFYHLILLPRIRDEISEFGRLTFHVHQSVRRAMFRPAAFFKGLILPLLLDSCTLREAAILCHLLSHHSIPQLHSSAALIRIADCDYTPPSSLFLHTLISKRYALPYRVIDALVDHFVRFQSDRRVFPVLWHQTLLAFVNNYAADIASEQREALRNLLKVHSHHQITDLIRDKLAHTKARDEEEVMTEPIAHEREDNC